MEGSMGDVITHLVLLETSAQLRLDCIHPLHELLELRFSLFLFGFRIVQFLLQGFHVGAVF